MAVAKILLGPPIADILFFPEKQATKQTFIFLTPLPKKPFSYRITLEIAANRLGLVANQKNLLYETLPLALPIYPCCRRFDAFKLQQLDSKTTDWRSRG